MLDSLIRKTAYKNISASQLHLFYLPGAAKTINQKKSPYTGLMRKTQGLELADIATDEDQNPVPAAEWRVAPGDGLTAC
jgi:hypothetical protein